jgi:hypothetical protein
MPTIAEHIDLRHINGERPILSRSLTRMAAEALAEMLAVFDFIYLPVTNDVRRRRNGRPSY